MLGFMANKLHTSTHMEFFENSKPENSKYSGLFSFKETSSAP